MSDDNYVVDEYIVGQRIAEDLASSGHDAPRVVHPPIHESKRDEAVPEPEVGGLISAKTVFYIVTFTALATAIVDPSLLIVTLPLATLVSGFLVLVRRKERRKPRRIGYGG